MLVTKYPYQSLNRITQTNGIRHYICPETGRHLPSVTTIIDQTSDKTGLLEWRKRVGEKEAERIKHEALGLGTLMHTHLECHIAGIPRPTGTNLVRQVAEAMADQIIQYGFGDLREIWGSEINIFSPGLYAGTIDGTGLYRLPSGKEVEVVFDFKTARKMKKKEHISNYFQQTCAYAIAHNELYKTSIETAIIFMVDRNFSYQHFIIEGDEFKYFTDQWFSVLEKYFEV